MIKKLFLALLLSTTSVYVGAQEAQDNRQSTQREAASIPEAQNHGHAKHPKVQECVPVGQPNYGSLVIGWGFNFLRGHPSTMNLNHLSSRSAGVCLCYNIRLGQSHFVVSPGIGMTFDGYEFKNKDHILARDEASRNTVFREASELFPKSTKILSSTLDERYIDIMLETRFNANNKCPKEGFFVAIGGEMGLLWGASTTVKYEEDDETKRQTNKEFFSLNRMRGGLYAKLGWGRFGLCYTHMLSKLFKKDEGPDSTSTKTCNLGLSIDLF